MLAQEKEQYWLGMVKHWQASGLSQAGFCRQEGIEYKAFCRWRKILVRKQLLAGSPSNRKAARRITKRAAKSVPVEIRPAPSELAAVPRAGVLEISTPSGYVVRIA